MSVRSKSRARRDAALYVYCSCRWNRCATIFVHMSLSQVLASVLHPWHEHRDHNAFVCKLEKGGQSAHVIGFPGVPFASLGYL